MYKNIFATTSFCSLCNLMNFTLFLFKDFLLLIQAQLLIKISTKLQTFSVPFKGIYIVVIAC